MVAKTRRPHKKSRNGCAECKQRHIRCDELQPTCANCQAAERDCSFLTVQVRSQLQKRSHRQLENQQQSSEIIPQTTPNFESNNYSNPGTVTGVEAEQQKRILHGVQKGHDQIPNHSSHYAVPTPNSLQSTGSLDNSPQQIASPALHEQTSSLQSPPAGDFPGLSTALQGVPQATFTSQHMILMHHAHRVPNFDRPNRSAVDIAVRHAIDSPYLLDEILAFTAFHMASLYHGSAPYLRQLATELQTRALESFTQLTKMVSSDDKATAVPRFLFSAILGRHALADTLTYCDSDFHYFIDRFIECINLNRGIRVVTPPARDYLYNSDLQPFIRVVLDAQEKITAPGTECKPLRDVMDDSDLNEASQEACRQAIDVLQWSFDLCQGLDEEDYSQAASAFSVRIGAGFVDVLRKHRPEALLILTYFGVLLYRCRSFWAFGNAGASMIRTIAERLGSYWQKTLEWPLHVIETEPGEQGTSVK